jgi:hypothetical protein
LRSGTTTEALARGAPRAVPLHQFGLVSLFTVHPLDADPAAGQAQITSHGYGSSRPKL